MWFKSKSSESKPAPPPGLTDAEIQLLRKVAQKVVDFQMTVPAILFLESMRPLNYIGSQTMHFFQPFVAMLFTTVEYEKFALLMENRDNIEKLICLIEEIDAEELRKRKAGKP